MKIGKIFLLHAAFASVLLPFSARAWDGAVSGKPTTFEITNGSNYGFRVYLENVANMCAGGPAWAYLNETDSNYKAYIAALMLAKAQGSKVIVYSALQSGYCHIGHLAIQAS